MPEKKLVYANLKGDYFWSESDLTRTIYISLLRSLDLLQVLQ